MFETEKNDLVLIVDALNLFTRHFVAHPAVSDNGNHIGGIIGFLYGLIDLTERFKPKKIVVIWEGGGSPRRRAILKEYKQSKKPEKLNRFYEGDIPDTVENRSYQIGMLIGILNNSPVCQMYIPDCEADDVIGYITKYTFSKNRKLILSSDKDFYQLLDKNTIIYSPTWKRLVTSKDVIKKFGVSTENFCLAKSIVGDPSDNIKGVKGAGFKTIAKRFPMMSENSFVSIDDLTEHASKMIAEGSKVKVYRSILESEHIVRRNWSLIYLDTVNLAASQIKKIQEDIDTFSPVKNKIKTMRLLIKEGIQTFNVDRFFLSFTHIGTK